MNILKTKKPKFWTFPDFKFFFENQLQANGCTGLRFGRLNCLSFFENLENLEKSKI